jgi:hypothetical protein
MRGRKDMNGYGYGYYTNADEEYAWWSVREKGISEHQ